MPHLRTRAAPAEVPRRRVALFVTSPPRLRLRHAARARPGFSFRLVLDFISRVVIVIAGFFFGTFFFVNTCGIVDKFFEKRLWLKTFKEVNLPE